MIGRLQRKFVLISIGSLLLILIVVIGGINAYNVYNMNQSADGLLELLAQNDGRFPERDRSDPPKGERGFRYQMTPETRFETRYFAVRLPAGDVDRMEVNTGFIAAVSEQQAAEYSADVLSGGRSRGYKGIYRYIKTENADGTLLIFLDRHMQLQMTRTYFWGSCSMALLCLAVMFVLVSILSKRAIRPVVESVEKQKQFITDAGHEIKTPLAIISATTDVLELKQGESEWTQSIRKQTGRLDALVKSLLTLSKMEEEKPARIFSDFSLSELVQEEADSFSLIAENQGRQVVRNIQPGLTIYGDATGLHQVVAILMDNAIKYADDNGSIHIDLKKQGKAACLEIRNTVAVFPDMDLNLLFERFVRADASRARESGGYGLGLSIAKAIVSLHKGKITAVREGERTICFSVWI